MIFQLKSSCVDIFYFLFAIMVKLKGIFSYLFFYYLFIYLSTQLYRMLDDMLSLKSKEIPLKKIQKNIFSLGAIMFTLATVATLPIINQKTSILLYTGFIRIAVILLVVS